MIFSSVKALFAASMGLISTAIAGAYVLQSFSSELDFLTALFYSTPLSILSSAIIIPSTHTFPEDKKSFLFELFFIRFIFIILNLSITLIN